MTAAPGEAHGDVGRSLRAVRKARSLSQRELAVLACVPLSTITGIEGGRRNPGVEVVDRILTAAGCRLAVVDIETGLEVSCSEDEGRDRGARRLPAHLARDSDPAVSERTFHHRPKQARGPVREHPWFGQFRARGQCRGSPTETCASCVDNCRFVKGRFGPDPETS